MLVGVASLSPSFPPSGTFTVETGKLCKHLQHMTVYVYCNLFYLEFFQLCLCKKYGKLTLANLYFSRINGISRTICDQNRFCPHNLKFIFSQMATKIEKKICLLDLKSNLLIFFVFIFCDLLTIFTINDLNKP